MTLNIYKKQLQRRGGQCQHSKCATTLNLTVDHIIPRQLLKCLGMEHFAETDEENFQVMCKKHNTEKANQLDYTNPRTLPLLKKYINMWIEKHSNYFIPPKERVFKIGVVCRCCPIPEPVIPEARETWRKSPGLAPILKADVVRPKSDVNQDNW